MMKIKYFCNEDLMPDRPTQLQIENLAREKLFKRIAVMPDVHSKFGRKCPTGTVAASPDSILPQVMDTAPNCGMRLIATPWGEKELNKKKINQLFLELIKKVPTRAYWGNYVDYKTTMRICRYGSSALLEKLNKSQEEVEHTYDRGNFFPNPPSEQAILSAIPKFFLKLAQTRLGILGEAGNHFLDLMRVEEVLDEKKSQVLGLKKGQYLFLIHTGSGIFGQYASYFFTPKKEEHFSTQVITKLGRATFSSQLLPKNDLKKLREEMLEYRERKEFFKIDPDSPRGKAYLIAHRAVANFGFANRTMITKNIETAIKNTLGEINLDTIYDFPHISLTREDHFEKEVWVHRNGASRGLGKSRMKEHPIFSKTGEPGIIAGSMSTPSYLVCGKDENYSTFYSINHGAGKTKLISRSAPKTKKELLENMRGKKIKLYNAKSKGVINQAEKYYKDVNQVVKIIEENKIATPVIKMSPIAVLMA